MRTNKKLQVHSMYLNRERGVALILVMISMLILSVLAATIVFTARAETFASYNFRLDTEADYMAKAGIQSALNWFRSSHYKPLRPCAPAFNPTYCSDPDPGTIYNLTSSGDPMYLYTSNSSPVLCLSGCSSSNTEVRLIGYGSLSTNYPTAITNMESTPRRVISAFASDLNNISNTRITGDTSNSGYYMVNATLLSYQTVNVDPPPPTVPAYCVQTTVVVCPVETWLITSKAIWTGSSTSAATIATAEEEAIVQPIFRPTWGNALYGFCSVSMTGSAGTCTDAFNSSLGAYAGGNGSVASGVCNQLTYSNVISSGAGVGSNGHVDLGTGVSVGGNVTIGSSPTGGSSCCTTSSSPACGYNGSASSVQGEVINGPHIDPPALPTYPTGFPTGTTNISLVNASPPLTIPTGGTWPATMDTTTNWPAGNSPADTPPPLSPTGPCMTGQTCNGTSSNPYLIGNISMTGSTLQIVGGTNALNPVYYDISCLSMTGGSITVSGYVVLNVQGGSTCTGSTGLDLEGNGISNGVACTSPCTNIPPEAVTINYSGTTKDVRIGGNGAISAILNAPYSNVTLGGGGANGYMVGAIQANNVTVSGGYPIHYDTQLSRLKGNLGTVVSTAYGRKKM